MTGKHFMIDIESTGIDPEKEDLLQIGILETYFGDDGYWHPGRELEIVQHSDKKPESEFAKEHMVRLYELCNRAPLWEAESLRWRVLQFFKQCGCEPPYVYLMGWNASNFDVPFLVKKGVLRPNYYELENGKDVMRGDFHYRIYEISGAISLCQNARSKDRKVLIEEAGKNLGGNFSLPPGKEHDAIYDCYKQLRILNGLIDIARRGY